MNRRHALLALALTLGTVAGVIALTIAPAARADDPVGSRRIDCKGSSTADVRLRVEPDGAGRFDITLLPDQERTLSIPGYKGPTVDCYVRYMPVSGHREKRANVTYMENNRDISVRLAQVPGQSYFVPVEIQIATLIGNLRIEATKIEGFEKPSDSTTAEAP